MLAAIGPPLLTMGEGREGIDARLGDHDDAAAIAAIAAIGSAARDVFLAAKAHAAITAIAGFDFDGDAVDEHGGKGSGVRIRRSEGNKNRDADRHPCRLYVE